MSQKDELEAVKRRIRLASDRTVDRGFTEAEMVDAMEKVGKLLSQYNLKMDEVFLKEEPCTTANMITKKKVLSPVGQLLSGIGRLTDTRVWCSAQSGKMTYFFFGLTTDVELAVYLAEMIERAIDHERKLFAKTDLYLKARNRTSTQNSFKNGMVNRIYQRLTAMKDALDFEMREEAAKKTLLIGSSVTSLTIVKKKVVEEEFKKMGMRLRSYGGGSVTRDGQAFSQGIVAANNVNLNAPITHQGESIKLLGN